jgi:hypothetical protein
VFCLAGRRFFFVFFCVFGDAWAGWSFLISMGWIFLVGKKSFFKKKKKKKILIGRPVGHDSEGGNLRLSEAQLGCARAHRWIVPADERNWG